MSIFSNQTERDLEKHPPKQFPTEGNYYDCFHGIKHVLEFEECKSCPFNIKCSLYSEMETRGMI